MCSMLKFCVTPLQITALQNQCARDSATISKLSMEINRLTSGRSDQGSEIGKLQRAVSVAVYNVVASRTYDNDDHYRLVLRTITKYIHVQYKVPLRF